MEGSSDQRAIGDEATILARRLVGGNVGGLGNQAHLTISHRVSAEAVSRDDSTRFRGRADGMGDRAPDSLSEKVSTLEDVGSAPSRLHPASGLAVLATSSGSQTTVGEH